MNELYLQCVPCTPNVSVKYPPQGDLAWALSHWKWHTEQRATIKAARPEFQVSFTLTLIEQLEIISRRHRPYLNDPTRGCSICQQGARYANRVYRDEHWPKGCKDYQAVLALVKAAGYKEVVNI